MSKRYDIVIEKGATWTRTFQCLESDGETPIDLTGYVARLTIRSPDVDGEIVLDARSDTSDPEIVIDGPEGKIEVDLGALATSADTLAGVCKGWYTLKRWPDGSEDEANRVAEGYVRWAPESTRDDPSGA